jgi:hypothetical protein
MNEGVASRGTGRAELVLTPRSEAETLDDCTRAVARSSARSPLLVVAFSLTAGDVLGSLRSAFGAPPEAVGVVSVGEQRRSTAAAPAGDSSADAPVNVTAVAGRDDMGRLATVFDLHLEELGAEATVYVGSVGALFEEGTPRAVFRVLHLLTTRIRATGATGRFFLDPDAVQARTVKTIEPLFDATRDERDGAAPSSGTGAPDGASTRPEDEWFGDALEAPIRRWLLAYLRDRQEAVPVDHLVNRALERDAEAPGFDGADRDRIQFLLYHEHVPKLVDAGLVVTDEGYKFVEATRAAEGVDIDPP